MKIFISYLATEKALAGGVKNELDDNGFDTFLAHEDIQPTKVWMDSIYLHLKETDIILTLLTKGFSGSVWCNQEVGIGLALDKLIIPIKIDQDPDGFLSKYQALKFTRDTSFPTAKMFAIIAAHEEYGASFRDFLIQVLADSQSFLAAERNAKKLIEIKDFTIEQLERIMEVSINNNQIYYGFSAKKILFPYMYHYRSKLDTTLYQKFYDKLRGKS